MENDDIAQNGKEKNAVACFYNMGQYGTYGKVAKYTNLKYFLLWVNRFIISADEDQLVICPVALF